MKISIIRIIVAGLCCLFLLPFVGCGGSSHTNAIIAPPGTADFYVATNGNDSWSGTLSAPNSTNSDGPFATLNRARQAVQGVSRSGRTSAITVMVRAGTYYCGTVSSPCQPLAFAADDSGSATVPIVYENYPSETPVISGGIQITGWTQNTTNGTWTVSLNPATVSYFEALYYNGTRRFRPRANSGNYLRLPGTNPVSTCGAGTDPCFDRFQFTAGDINPAWVQLTNQCAPGQTTNCYPPGDIEVRTFEKWAVPAFRLDHVDATADIAYLRSQAINNQQNYGFMPNHRYLIDNVKDFCCSTAQWFLDRSFSTGNNWVLTYSPEANANETDPNNDTVVVPQLSMVLLAKNLSYVTFQGITFSHDNFTVPAGAFPPAPCTKYQNCATADFQGIPDVTAAVSCINCNNVTFDSVTLSHTTGWGLEIVPDGSFSGTVVGDTVQNSVFYDIGASGAIRIGLAPQNGQPETDATVPQNITVQNNLIQSIGRIYPGAAGAIWGGIIHDATITHNEISDTYHSGIAICVPDQKDCIGASNSHGAFNITVSNNHIWNLGQGVTDDMACVYFATFGATGNQITNNRCHDVSDASSQEADGYGGNGIYLDGPTYGVTVENNLVYRVSWVGFFVNEGPQSSSDAPNTVKNNIFAYPRMATVQRSFEVPAGPVLWANVNDNIVYWDRNDPANGESFMRGCWYCWGTSCSQSFNFDKNIYWRTSGDFSTAPDVILQTDSACSTQTLISFSAWRSAPYDEDPNSTVQNPGFVNPTCSASTAQACATDATQDNFQFAGVAPPNFAVLDFSSFGLTSAPTTILPAVPPGFRTAPFDPATDY